MFYNTEKVCFNTSSFYTFLLLNSLVIIYIVYYYYKTSLKERLANVDLMSHLSSGALQTRLKELQDSLFNEKLNTQRCLTTLNAMSQQTPVFDSRLSPPERDYPGPGLDQRGRRNSEYQQVGYVYSDTIKYPLFGRPKYYDRSDKMEYYIIDDSRNRIKIPFETINNNELTSSDTVSVPSVDGSLNVKIYDLHHIRYNPYIFN